MAESVSLTEKQSKHKLQGGCTLPSRRRTLTNMHAHEHAYRPAQLHSTPGCENIMGGSNGEKVSGEAPQEVRMEKCCNTLASRTASR